MLLLILRASHDGFFETTTLPIFTVGFGRKIFIGGDLTLPQYSSVTDFHRDLRGVTELTHHSALISIASILIICVDNRHFRTINIAATLSTFQRK